MFCKKSIFGIGSYVIPTVIEVLINKGDVSVTEAGLKGGDEYQRKIARAVELVQRLLENIIPLHCRYVR